ncbi:MAG: hypothetical protein FJ034_03295 [Chloroflexi bacterium]|nr:hypothetical protein [Chloroflexota bacterium]
MREGRLDIPGLIDAGSLDARTAALCTLVLERHGSLVIAAGPQRAGKTTTLEALLATLPARIRRIDLAGESERFAFAATADPTSTLLVAAELSDHLPGYTWGRPGRRTFELLRQGYALAATMHADGVAECGAILTQDLGAPAADVARVDLFVLLRVYRTGRDQVARRLVAVSRLAAAGDTLRETRLVTYDETRDRHIHHQPEQHDAVSRAALAERTAEIEAGRGGNLALGGTTA